MQTCINVYLLFFKQEKDTYNNEVTKIARPLPVEYLLVDLPAAFAKEAIYTFNEGCKFKTDFAIENRAVIGESQVNSNFFAYLVLVIAGKFSIYSNKWITLNANL